MLHSPFIRKVLPSLLHFIGGRPLVGYYVDFDIAMLDKYVLPYIEIELPNRRVEISKLYYERKYGDTGQYGRRSLFRFDALTSAYAARPTTLQRRADDGDDVRRLA